EPVRRRLEQAVRRIRVCRALAGAGRWLLLLATAVLLLYAADRALTLPMGVRALLVGAALVLLARETWRSLLRPQVDAPGLLDAARLVERAEGSWEVRLVSALQLPPGRPGSLEHAVARQAAD